MVNGDSYIQNQVQGTGKMNGMHHSLTNQLRDREPAKLVRLLLSPVGKSDKFPIRISKVQDFNSLGESRVSERSIPPMPFPAPVSHIEQNIHLAENHRGHVALK